MVKITAIVITKEKTNIVCIIQRSIFHEVSVLLDKCLKLSPLFQQGHTRKP
jgi:hypothetical protein